MYEAVCGVLYVRCYLFHLLGSKEKSAKGKQRNAGVTIVTSLAGDAEEVDGS